MNAPITLHSDRELRDLDLTILEKIFGFPRGKAFKAEFGDDWQYIPSGKSRRTHMIDARLVPRFSERIQEAWLIVEAMHKRGYWCRTQTPWRQSDTDYWAGFTEHEWTGWNGRPDYWTSASSLPVAICLAALKAVTAIEKAERDE